LFGGAGAAVGGGAALHSVHDVKIHLAIKAGIGQQAIQQLAMRRDRMAFGTCGYDRNDGYSECEGRLRWRDAMNQKQKFAQDLRSLQMQAESVCRDRACSQIDISRVVRDFDAFVSQLSTQRIVFDGINSTPFIDFPGQYRVNCSGWFPVGSRRNDSASSIADIRVQRRLSWS
jgi:hypothetical protein